MPATSLSILHYVFLRLNGRARGYAQPQHISTSRSVSWLGLEYSCLFPCFDIFGTNLTHSHSRLGANSRVTSELGKGSELS
jgi:hypothetical protein